MIDNASPGGSVAATACAVRLRRRRRPRPQRGLLGADEHRRPARLDGDARPAQRRLRLRRRLRRAPDRAARSGGRRRDELRRASRPTLPGTDRQRRDGARPHAARLRLPERRADVACSAEGAGRSDRALAEGRRLRSRRVPRGRRFRREPLRLLGGRRPDAEAARGGRQMQARARRRRDARALGDARVGLEGEELPDRLRSRLRPAEVAGGEPAAGCRRSSPGIWSSSAARRQSTGPSPGRVAGSPAGERRSRPTSSPRGSRRRGEDRRSSATSSGGSSGGG